MCVCVWFFFCSVFEISLTLSSLILEFNLVHFILSLYFFGTMASNFQEAFVFLIVPYSYWLVFLL